MKNAVSHEEEKAKALLLIRVYLLDMQQQTLAFSDKICTEVNGLVFEIDRALKKESPVTKGSTEGGRRKE